MPAAEKQNTVKFRRRDKSVEPHWVRRLFDERGIGEACEVLTVTQSIIYTSLSNNRINPAYEQLAQNYYELRDLKKGIQENEVYIDEVENELQVFKDQRHPTYVISFHPSEDDYFRTMAERMKNVQYMRVDNLSQDVPKLLTSQ